MQDPRLGTAPLDQQDDAEGIDLREIARVLNKHRWEILGLTLLVALIGALLVYRQTPLYQATATLLIERSPARFAPIQDPYIAYTEHYLYYETQYGLIKRRSIGERVVDELDLVARLQPSPGAPTRAGFSWKALLPADWFPTPQAPTEAQRREALVGMVVGAISVQPRDKSQLVDLKITHGDPKLAAELANAVARAFIQDNLEGRMEMVQQASSFLTERLVELKRQLEESENELKRFLEREQLVDASGIDSLANQELALVSEKLQAARRDRTTMENTFRQIQDALGRQALDLETVPGLLEYAQVQRAAEVLTGAERKVSELAARYGPLHPTMIEARTELDTARESFDQQLRLVIGIVEKRYRSAQAAERAAEAEFERVKDELREIDRQEFTLTALEREVETNRQLFEKFQTQFKETDAAGGVQTANARIIELARVPGAPVKPNKKRSIMLSLFFGLVLSIGLAFLLEHLDNTLKGAEDTERRLELPVLGMLPTLDERGQDRLAPLRQFRQEPKSTFAEAIRTIRTGVLLASLDQPSKVLLVTSSIPGEGKTTLSVNLSQALSEMKSVLLIDADMRRPMVAKAMENESGRGLSHFIAGEAELAQAVQRVSERFHVMPAGVVPPNPLELLSSPRFATALQRLGEKYDHIVVDCAPALVVSDAMVLSRLATAVVYVVRADATPTQAAQSGLKRLRRCGAPLIGAVVNRAARRSKPYYGKYSVYYEDSYYYASYYGAEQPAAEKA